VLVAVSVPDAVIVRVGVAVRRVVVTVSVAANVAVGVVVAVGVPLSNDGTSKCPTRELFDAGGRVAADAVNSDEPNAPNPRAETNSPTTRKRNLFIKPFASKRRNYSRNRGDCKRTPGFQIYDFRFGIGEH
jgi:hypothetical protein